MEEKYYIGLKPQTDDRHRIHKEGCPFMPDEGKRSFLGSFVSPNVALKEGNNYFEGSSRCQFCIPQNDKKRKISSFTADYHDNSIISSDAIIPALESSLVCVVN